MFSQVRVLADISQLNENVQLTLNVTVLHKDATVSDKLVYNFHGEEKLQTFKDSFLGEIVAIDINSGMSSSSDSENRSYNQQNCVIQTTEKTYKIYLGYYGIYAEKF